MIMVATNSNSHTPALRGAGLDYETRSLVLESLKEFGRRELPDELLLELDAEERFPEELVRQIFGPEIGLHLLFLPEEVGGMDAGALDICTVSEALAGLDLGVATSVLATALGTDPLLVGGTPAQKERWLTRIADEGLLVAYGVTEPGAGSNLAAIRSRAEPTTLDGKPAYRLNGQKCFITNGSVADLYTILANTPGGPSFFVVEKGTKGLIPGRKESKHGIRASDTAEVLLEDVVLPADHLVGGVEGQGLAQAAEVFGYTRLMVAAFGLGAGVDAQRRAIAYARERVQFDTTLVSKQGLTHKLILPHVARLQAARAYVQEVARRIDAGEEELQVEGSIAKLFATEAGGQAADAAVQVHGGYGYVREYFVEKIRRDVRITTIYEGTSEINQEVAGRGRWRQLLIGRGKLYEDLAVEMKGLGSGAPDVGAARLEASARAMVALVQHARKARLGRQQHVIFELARAVAALESAAAFSRKAAGWQAHAGRLPETTHQGWPEGWPADMAAMARLQAAEACGVVANVVFGVLAGTATLSPKAAANQDGALHPGRMLAGFYGAVKDMDQLAARLPTEDLLADPPLVVD
jgi:alkylation response protein AidB-like acyl-CoA dehydrogenase